MIHYMDSLLPVVRPIMAQILESIQLDTRKSSDYVLMEVPLKAPLAARPTRRGLPGCGPAAKAPAGRRCTLSSRASAPCMCAGATRAEPAQQANYNSLGVASDPFEFGERIRLSPCPRRVRSVRSERSRSRINAAESGDRVHWHGRRRRSGRTRRVTFQPWFFPCQ